jgi:class 3 adenylate cyclase
LAPSGLLSQDSVDVLKNRLDNLSGKDQLVVLNQISALYLEEGNSKKALRYAKDARYLADVIITEENKLITENDYYLKPLSYLWLGIAHLQRGHYLESQEALQVALAEAERLDLPEIAYKARWNLQAIESEVADTSRANKGILKNAFRSIGSGVNKTTAEMSVNTNIKLAEHHEKNENYKKAIEYYKKAIEFMKNLGDWARVYELEEHIAGLLEKDGQFEEAMIAYDDIGLKIENIDDTAGMDRIETRKTEVRQKMDSAKTVNQFIENISSMPVLEEDPILKTEGDVENLRRRAEEAEETQDYQQSLYYYKEYLAMEKQLSEEKRDQELLLLEKVNEIENRDREILLLKQNEEINTLRLAQNQTELNKQQAFKRNLAIGIFLLAGLVFALYLLYRNKRRDHRKLGIAYNDLEETKDNLKNAEQRIKSLLHEQVSGAVANELLASDDARKIERRFVCIMFLDIRDFTPFAEKKRPEEIIEYQNKVFGFMIDTVNKHNGIVNQILGDGFMATFGAPVSSENDCLQAYLAAKEIIRDVRERSQSGEIPETEVGVGLHAGYVVTGNVGTKGRKQYSITGNTVILAARLEQLNKDFGSSLVISREVYEKLPEEKREPAEFNKVTVKGRSEPMEVAAF